MPISVTQPLMKRDKIVEVLDEALKVRGLTAAEASELAVGNRSLIHNLRRERYGAPKVDSLQALADVLGLELYFGPKRREGFAEEAAQFEADQMPTMLPIPFNTEAGGRGDQAAVAVPFDWIRSLTPNIANLEAVEVRETVPIVHLIKGDLAIIDTFDKSTDGRPMAFFTDLFGAVNVSPLYGEPGGTYIGPGKNGNGIVYYGDRPKLRIVGKVVAALRRFPEPPKLEMDYG